MNTKQYPRNAAHGRVLARIAAAGLLSLGLAAPAPAADDPYADPEAPALPPSDMELDLTRTALVITDPQVDFLSPDGVTWGVIGASVQEHDTVANLERLFAAAKKADLVVTVSPHYYYPTDKGWKFEGCAGKAHAQHRHVQSHESLRNRGPGRFRRGLHAGLQAVHQ